MVGIVEDAADLGCAGRQRFRTFGDARDQLLVGGIEDAAEVRWRGPPALRPIRRCACSAAGRHLRSCAGCRRRVPASDRAVSTARATSFWSAASKVPAISLARAASCSAVASARASSEFDARRAGRAARSMVSSARASSALDVSSARAAGGDPPPRRRGRCPRPGRAGRPRSARRARRSCGRRR